MPGLDFNFDKELKAEREKKPRPIGKSRSVKTREFKFEWGTVYKIGEKVRFVNGKRLDWGKLLQAKWLTKTPHKISFTSFNFYQGKFSKPGHSLAVTYKNGSLNVFLTQGGITRCKSLKPSFLSRLNLERTSQARRIAKLINQLLKSHGDKRKIVLKDVTLANLDKTVVNLCYPGAKNLPKLHEVSNLYSHILKEEIGLRKICKKVFGRIGKMPKMVAENQKVLIYGVLWKGLIPFDYFLQKNYVMDDLLNRWQDGELCAKNFRKLVSRFSEPRRIELFKECKQSYYLRDSVRMFSEIPEVIFPDGLKTWRQIHDYLIDEHHKLKTINRDIKYPAAWEKIDGSDIGEMRLWLPRKTHDLVSYGQTLNNCIGSYADSAIKGSSQLFALYEQGELKYNGEIRGKELRQLVGSHNRQIEPQKRELVVDFFKKSDIIYT